MKTFAFLSSRYLITVTKDLAVLKAEVTHKSLANLLAMSAPENPSQSSSTNDSRYFSYPSFADIR